MPAGEARALADSIDLAPDARVVIVGAPRSGKTTIAKVLSERHLIPALHTDDVIRSKWSRQSEIVSEWFDKDGPWIIEGMSVPRALRKWIAAHPGEPRPYTRAICCWDPYVPLLPGQASMARGARTIWSQVCRQFA